MRDQVQQQVIDALQQLNLRYEQCWQNTMQTLPQSVSLCDISSPCVVFQDSERVYWQPQPRCQDINLQAVEQALDIQIREDIHAYFSAQFAADMAVNWQSHALILLQVWNEEDWSRLQENLIGHLVAQRQRKCTPTLFLALTDDDNQIVSVCNLTGAVVLERLGSSEHTVLVDNLVAFLGGLQPRIAEL